MSEKIESQNKIQFTAETWLWLHFSSKRLKDEHTLNLTCGFTTDYLEQHEHFTANTSASQWHTWWFDRPPAGCRAQRTPAEHWHQRADPQSPVLHSYMTAWADRGHPRCWVAGGAGERLHETDLKVLILNSFNQNIYMHCFLHFNSFLVGLYRNSSALTYTNMIFFFL